MTKEEIAVFANTVTYDNNVTIIKFKNNESWFGYFDFDEEHPANRDANEWNFVRFSDKKRWHFNGDDVLSINITVLQTPMPR